MNCCHSTMKNRKTQQNEVGEQARFVIIAQFPAPGGRDGCPLPLERRGNGERPLLPGARFVKNDFIFRHIVGALHEAPASALCEQRDNGV